MRGVYYCPISDPKCLAKPDLLMLLAKPGGSLAQQRYAVTATGENGQGLICRRDDILSDPWAN
jgi:hypothetical protein